LHAVHGKPVLIEMKKWRGHIEYNRPALNTIPWLSQPIRPWMEKRDSGGTSFGRSGFEVFHSSENLYSPMAKRRAEHSMCR
jgi:hypothetical protein